MGRNLRLSILAKLVASSFVLLLFLGLVGLGGYRTSEDAQTELAIDHRQATLALLSQRAQAIVFRQATAIRSYLLFADDKYAHDYDVAGDDVKKVIGEAQQIAVTAQTQAELKALLASETEYIQAGQRVNATLSSGKRDEALEILSRDVVPLLTRVMNQTAALTDRLTSESVERNRQSNINIDKAQRMMLGELLAAVIIGLFLSIVMARSLSAPIRRLALTTARVADGDLTVEPLSVSMNDEVADVTVAFNRMVANLQGLLRNVTASSQSVSGAAQQLQGTTAQMAESAGEVTRAVGQVAGGAASQSDAAQRTNGIVAQLQSAIAQIAAGAQEQAGSAQATARLVDVMVSAVSEARDTAGSVAALAEQARAAAESGGQVVERAAEGMTRIHAAVQTSAEHIQKLGQVSSEIGVITTAISAIAGQTNLLALNAAIEAARAGEGGRGFAVVAEEVRKLAERSSKSATEIAGLIQSIQSGTGQAVESMNQVTAEVGQGAALTQDTGRALREIRGVVERTAHDVRTITGAVNRIDTATGEVTRAVNNIAASTEENTAATEQMAAGSDQVNEAIQDIAAISEENAAAAEEVSASMEELNAGSEAVADAAARLGQVSRELQEQVSRFKL
ncbi:MAG TPA: methyl-accepting chemotaxis protein [Symbiobacteriaceae bacterium]